MPAEKIAITLDRELVKEIDRGVRTGLYRNRSRAIEEAVREKLDRRRRHRLSVEAKKLDRKEERALAEEGMGEPAPQRARLTKALSSGHVVPSERRSNPRFTPVGGKGQRASRLIIDGRR